MTFAISKWHLVAVGAVIVAIAVGAALSFGDRAEGVGTPGMNGIIESSFSADIPPPISEQHSACKAKVTTSGSTVTLLNSCYNVTKTGSGTPPAPPPPPPPFASLAAPGIRTELTGTMDGNGDVTLGFAGNPCLPADSDDDMDVDDGVTVELTTTVKDDTISGGTVLLSFFLNDLTCSGTPTSTASEPFSATTLSDTDDSDIDDPNITGTKGPDGCSTSEELGDDEASGGNRDPWNPWDFYDIDGDTTIDLFNDIFGVAGEFGAPDPSPNLDRSAPVGPDPWNMGPPDNTIDLFNDVFGVAAGFGHTCTGAF